MPFIRITKCRQCLSFSWNFSEKQQRHRSFKSLTIFPASKKHTTDSPSQNPVYPQKKTLAKKLHWSWRFECTYQKAVSPMILREKNKRDGKNVGILKWQKVREAWQTTMKIWWRKFDF